MQVVIDGKDIEVLSSDRNIVMSRDDLKLLRKIRLQEFKEFKKKNKSNACCSSKNGCCE